MRLTGFIRFLGRSSSTRPLFTPCVHTPHRSRFSNLIPNLISPIAHSDPYPDYGTYSIILPPEPFQFGTSHIPVLSVPPSIPRPRGVIERYGGGESDGAVEREGNIVSWEGDGRLELNGDEERRIKKAAQLAKKVREFAGSLVKVRLFPSHP